MLLPKIPVFLHTFVYGLFFHNLPEAKQQAKLFLNFYVSIFGMSYLSIWFTTLCKENLIVRINVQGDNLWGGYIHINSSLSGFGFPGHTEYNLETASTWLVIKWKRLSHNFELNYMCCPSGNVNIPLGHHELMWYCGVDIVSLGMWQKN